MVSDSVGGGWMWYVYDNMAMSHGTYTDMMYRS